MGNGQHVLVVDGLSETEQVLKAVLEPRGMQVDRVRGRSAAARSARRPSVVVLHEESCEEPSDLDWGDIPRIVIGTAVVPDSAEGTDGDYLPQPFHYGRLIAAIERALDRGPSPAERDRA